MRLVSGVAALVAGSVISSGWVQAEVDAQGAYTHDIEIELPESVGPRPELALTYNSQGGNGAAGLGWSLDGLALITRIHRGNGIEYGAGDTFAGPAGRLVPQQPATSGAHYFPEHQNWDKYVPYGPSGSVWTAGGAGCGNGPCSWKVFAADGDVLEFGGTQDSRIEAVNRGGAVRVWALSRHTDAHGNFYTVTYSEDAINGDYYPVRVTYNQGNGRSRFYTVELFFEVRNDSVPSHAQNTPVVDNGRLKTIKVSGGSQRIREYELGYNYSPLSGQSRLIEVTEYGSDGQTKVPSQKFAWQDGTNAWTWLTRIEGWGLHAGFTNESTYPTVTGDWNGDGKTDIGRVWNEGTAFRLSTGTDWAAYPDGPNWSLRTGFSNGSRYPMFTGDWNGDGKTDIARVGNTGIGFYVSTGSGWQEYASVAGWGPDAGFADANVYPLLIGDWNGDGRTDVGRVWNEGTAFKVSTGTGWADYAYGPSWGPSTGFSNADRYPVLTGDWNGDGKTDLGRVHDNGLDFYVSTGSGWTQFHGVAGAWGPLHGFADGNVYPLVTGDWNGDGRTDIGRFWNEGIAFKLSTATGWADYAYGPNWGPSTGFSNANAYPVVTGDWNGDGLTDVGRVHNHGVAFITSTGAGWRDFAGHGNWGVISNGYTDGNVYPMLSGDWTGEGKSGLGRVDNTGISFITRAGTVPDLVVSIDNGVRGTTSITYVPAPLVANAVRPDLTTCGSASGALCGNANASPQPLVTRVALSDGRGSTYTSTYEYFNARYHPGVPADTENLGFEWTSATEDQWPRTTLTRYRQDKPYHGLAATIEEFAGSSRVIQARTLYAYTAIDSPVGTQQIRPSSEEREVYDGALLRYRLRTTYAYDTYANVTLESQLNDASTSADDVFAATSYVNVVGRFVGLPQLERACADAACSLILRQSANYYDNLGLGQVGTRGLPTRQAQWRSDKGTYLDTQLTYDSAGNRLTLTNAAGVVAERSTYDAASGALVQLEDAAGNAVRSEYDPDTGELIALIDANGNRSTFQYDVLGRRERTETPNDGATRAVIIETLSFSPHQRGTTRVTDTGSITTTEHLDGLGRVWKTTRTWDNGTELQTDAHFDGAGRAHKDCAPHLVGEPQDAASCTTRHFDGRGRVVRVEAPRSGGGFAETTTAYEGYLTRVTDPANQVTTTQYDPSTLTESLTQPRNLVTLTTRDRLGRVVRVRDPAANLATTTYNSLDWRLTENDPVTGATSYDYDSLGNPIEVTDAAGVITRSYYDAASRMVRTDYAPLNASAAGAEDTVLKYDHLDQPGDVSNGKGRMVRVADTSGVTRFGYDEAGRVTSTRRAMDGAEFVTRSSFDRAGRRATVTYPNGAVVRYVHGTSAGHLSAILLDEAEVIRYENYNVRGVPTSFSYGQGADSVALTFEAATGDLLRHHDTRGFLDNAYAYDVRGMLLREQDQRANRPNGDTSKAFAYDENGQVVGAAMGSNASCSSFACSGEAWARTYEYDTVGRVLQKDGKTFTYDTSRYFQLRRIAGETGDRTYDAVGRLLTKTIGSGATDSYVHGPNGFLQAHLRGGATLNRMTYDYQGLRVKKEYLGTHPQTAWDIGNYKVVLDHSTGKYFHTVYVMGLHDSRIAHRTVERPGLIAAHADASSAARPVEPASGARPWSSVGAAAPMLASGPPLVAIGFLMSLALLVMFMCRRAITVTRARLRGRREPWLPRGAWNMIPALACVLLIACVSERDDSEIAQALIEDGRYNVLKLSDGATNQPVPGTFYYLNSPLGSTSVMFDGQGTALLRLEYFPDGTVNLAASVGDYIASHTFGQKEYDKDLEAYYNEFRYYDPETFRFTTPDAVKDSGDFLVHNTYAYARNNPVNFTDPTGFWAMKADGVGGRRTTPAAPPARSVPRVTRLGSMQVDGRAAPRVSQRWVPASRPAHVQRSSPRVQSPDNGPVPPKPKLVPARQSQMIDGPRGPQRARSRPDFRPTDVYVSINSGVLTYVGITNDLGQRQQQHWDKSRRTVRLLMSDLSRFDAACVEEAIIVMYERNSRRPARLPAGGTLDNKIHSISPNDRDYPELVQHGKELLSRGPLALQLPERSGPTKVEEQLAQAVIDKAIARQEAAIRQQAGYRYSGGMGSGRGGGGVGANFAGGGMKLRM